MPKSIFPVNTEVLHRFSRRSIFKLAPAAVLATGGAVVAFPALSEPLTLDQEIEASVERLKDLLSEKYPHAIPSEWLSDKAVRETREGGYIVTLMAQPPTIKWSGEGYYEIFVDTFDKKPTLMWVTKQWNHMDRTYGYRAYVRENGKQVSSAEYYSERSLYIHKKR